MVDGINRKIEKAKKLLVGDDKPSEEGMGLEQELNDLKKQYESSESQSQEAGYARASGSESWEEEAKADVKALDSEMEPDRIEVSAEDFQELGGEEDEKDLQVERRLEVLERKVGEIGESLRNFESQMVSEESEELSGLQDLRQKVQQLEFRDYEELERRLETLEEKSESSNSSAALRRIEELEEEILEDGSFREKVRQETEKVESERTEKLEEKIDSIAERLENVESRAESLEDENSEILDRMDSINKKQKEIERELDEGHAETEKDIKNLEQKINSLWEGLDEEVASLESEIHDNRKQTEELLDDVVELSEAVKDGLNHR